MRALHNIFLNARTEQDGQLGKVQRVTGTRLTLMQIKKSFRHASITDMIHRNEALTCGLTGSTEKVTLEPLKMERLAGNHPICDLLSCIQISIELCFHNHEFHKLCVRKEAKIENMAEHMSTSVSTMD